MRTHIIYLTTNLINGKIYVGQHTTDNINDGYLGSGRRLLKAIKKYGKENFTRVVLHVCEGHEELNELERSIVNKKFVDRLDTYNVAIGGDGGFTHSEASKILISESSTNMWANRSEEEKLEIANKISQKLLNISDEIKSQRALATSNATMAAWIGNDSRKEAASARMSKSISAWWSTVDRDEIKAKRKEIWANMEPETKINKSISQSSNWKSKSETEIKKIVEKRKLTTSQKSQEEKLSTKQRQSEANRKARLAASPRYTFVNNCNEFFIGNRHEFSQHTGFTPNQVKTLLDKRKQNASLFGWVVKERL